MIVLLMSVIVTMALIFCDLLLAEIAIKSCLNQYRLQLLAKTYIAAQYRAQIPRINTQHKYPAHQNGLCCNRLSIRISTFASKHQQMSKLIISFHAAFFLSLSSSGLNIMRNLINIEMQQCSLAQVPTLFITLSI